MSQSESSPSDKNPPFSNCRFQVCDLPGQCRSEGKCHHPASLSAASSSVGDSAETEAENPGSRIAWLARLRRVLIRNTQFTDANIDHFYMLAGMASPSSEPTRKILCQADGDRCLGCDHYKGKAPICAYAPVSHASSNDARDAARYRWLRSSKWYVQVMSDLMDRFPKFCVIGTELDGAIDAEMNTPIAASATRESDRG